MKVILTVAAMMFAFATQAYAAKMSGQEVAALMGQGTINFVAGSEWTTLTGGRYTFTHGSASGEEGTFTIFSNGNVEILDERTGRKKRFYFDRGSDGVPALIYRGGNGKRFPIVQ